MLGRKLEYLIVLAKEAHFARAAAVCHVSHPTLSAAIQHLEAELGIQIVKRGQRFRGLTGQGELVLAAAQHMAIECDRLHQKLRDQRNDFSGTVRPMAEAFFKVATSDEASRTIHNLMRSTTGVDRSHQPDPLKKGKPSLVPLAKAQKRRETKCQRGSFM